MMQFQFLQMTLNMLTDVQILDSASSVDLFGNKDIQRS